MISSNGHFETEVWTESEDAMSIDVEEFSTDRGDEWDSLVEQSPQATPFHRFGMLEVAAEHANATLHPLVGYKGREPVGLFPVFVVKKGPVSTAFSPPPSLKITYLGPATLNLEKLKPGKAERRNRRFVEAALDHVEEHVGPQYVHVRTSTRYEDTRPFTWNGFEATPHFTYVVDISDGPDALFDRFSRDARKNVRDARETDCVVEERGVEAARTVVDQVRKRHEEQDEWYPLTTKFVTDLYEAAPDGVVRPYVCDVDGETVGGSIVLEEGDTAYGWQGVVKPDVDLDVNDVVHWHVINDVAERGVTRYDLVGANQPRLSRYKSKFAPTLVSYDGLEKSSPGMSLAARTYKRLR